jgi:hypothetical protein
MSRSQTENDCWELEYACSYGSLAQPIPCRERTGTEKKNSAARYGSRPARSSSATQGIHRRGRGSQSIR